jgi:hypothetical protein
VRGVSKQITTSKAALLLGYQVVAAQLRQLPLQLLAAAQRSLVIWGVSEKCSKLKQQSRQQQLSQQRLALARSRCKGSDLHLTQPQRQPILRQSHLSPAQLLQQHLTTRA